MLDAFKAEQAALSRFTEILQQEQQALVKVDADQLALITNDKVKQAEVLNGLATLRVAALEKLGVQSDRASVETWLKSQPNEMTNTWNDLLSAAKIAQQLNQSNGALIESQLRHNQQALNTRVSSPSHAGCVHGPPGYRWCPPDDCRHSR